MKKLLLITALLISANASADWTMGEGYRAPTQADYNASNQRGSNYANQQQELNYERQEAQALSNMQYNQMHQMQQENIDRSTDYLNSINGSQR